MLYKVLPVPRTDKKLWAVFLVLKSINHYDLWTCEKTKRAAEKEARLAQEAYMESPEWKYQWRWRRVDDDTYKWWRARPDEAMEHFEPGHTQRLIGDGGRVEVIDYAL